MKFPWKREASVPRDDDVHIDPDTGQYPPNPGENDGRLDFPGPGEQNPLHIPPPMED